MSSPSDNGMSITRTFIRISKIIRDNGMIIEELI